MPAKPVQVGDLYFSRKGDATKFFQEMLYRYDVGDRVSQEDTAILTKLIAMHPESTAKTGSGIANFSVRSGGFGTQCFWVNRTDATTEKFSFGACY